MGRIAVESIPTAVGREEDGRWWADIESMPGVMPYGETRIPIKSDSKVWLQIYTCSALCWLTTHLKAYSPVCGCIKQPFLMKTYGNCAPPVTLVKSPSSWRRVGLCPYIICILLDRVIRSEARLNSKLTPAGLAFFRRSRSAPSPFR
jgi:hypothetical protein